MEQDKYELEEQIFNGLKEKDKKQNNEALSLLYKNYFHSTTQIIKQEGGLEADRKDIFQEAILKFIKNIRIGSYLYERGKMGGYIRTLVLGYWRNQRRRKKAEQLTEVHTDQYFYEGENEIMDNFEREESQKLFIQLLRHLSEKCKSIILGRYRNEYSDSELALQWGYSDKDSLKQGRRTCIKNLKQKALLYSIKKY